ncbi:MAG: ABC transporter ATP-binding protein/permease [Planctomycetes bacterium]|nr:ABC transporter ATP-binding protein/permease [Planctomycetota bacterium]
MSDPYADDAPEGRFQLGFLQQLWPFVRPYRRGFLACLLILLLSFGLELLGPKLLGMAIDGPMRATALPRDERITSLLWFGLGFVGTTLGGALLGYVYGLLTAWNGQRVIRDLRRHLFDHLLSTSLAFHEKNPAGKLTTRVTSDVENINELIATGVLQSVFDLLKILGVLIALFFLDLELALFTVATTPIVVVISILFRRNAQRAYRAVRGRLALQNAYTTELIGGVRTTRAFGREQATEARYAERNRDTAVAWRATVLHFSVFFSLVDFALRATTVGLLWFGGNAVLDGTLRPGQFVEFWLYYGLLVAPVKELGEKYNVLQAAFASCERVFQLLGEPRFPPPSPTGRVLPSPRRGAAKVEFDRVTFAYGFGAPVLHELSFSAEPGQTIAIVGPTGAGKTTILSLVARLREVSGGTVRLDGTDVRELAVDDLRRRVAYVAQDLFLFTGSVLDNVRLFDPSIDEARVWQALETVGAAEFVRKLPQGLASAVEERGGTFSQGERQLLAFARALVVEPDVLVLDEATASIDSASEARLQQALEVSLRGRTALVVAHRLSTVRNADRILVLDRGRIVEAGSHRELIARGGAYAAMLAHVGDGRADG